MKRLILAALAATLAACSNAPLSSATAPSALAPLATGTSGGGISSARAFDPAANSCPSEPPSGLVVTTNASGGAEAHWNAVPNAQDYVLEIRKRQATNAYEIVDGFPVAEDGVTRAFVLHEGGAYQARVRTRSCGNYGNWSAVFEFSTGKAQEPVNEYEQEWWWCFLE